MFKFASFDSLLDDNPKTNSKLGKKEIKRSSDTKSSNEHLNHTYSKLKVFQVDDKATEFEKLALPVRKKILHTKVIFQGIENSLFDIIGNDIDILNLLTVREIQILISKDQKLKIGETYKTTLKNKFIDRKFIECKYNVCEEAYTTHIRTFGHLQTLITVKRTFILADSAGTGKTTVFEDMTRKLKQNYQKFWVSYIKLPKHVEVLEQYKKLERDLTIEEILNLLLDILYLESEFEIEIFTKLYFNNRIILLLDEIDEISPQYKEFVISVLFTLRKNTKIQLWISSRTEHCKKLEETFDINSYKFVPLSSDEKRQFITDTLITLKVTNQKFHHKLLDDFEKIFKNIKNQQSVFSIINNLLLIEMLTELCVDEKFCLWSEQLNLYGIFEKFIAQKIKKVDSPNDVIGIFKDMNASTDDFTLMNVHHVFALILLFNHDYLEQYQFYIEDFLIIRQWDIEKYKWTFEKIQKYDLLTIDLDNPKYKIDSLTFTRRMYGEYFIANFLIPFLFYADSNVDNHKYEQIYKMLKIIMYEINDFDMVRCFLFSYMIDESRIRRFQNEIKELLLKYIFHIHKDVLEFVCNTGSLKSLENWSAFLIIEPTLLKLLWCIGKNNNYIKKLLCKKERKRKLDIKELLELVNKIFGTNWHKIFNKSRIPLINDEEIGDIEKKEHEKCKGFNRNLIKFLDLTEKNYGIEEKQFVYKEYISNYKIIPFVNVEVFKKILINGSVIFQENSEDFVGFLVKYLKHSPDIGILKIFGERLEMLLEYNAILIRNVLFNTFTSHCHPLIVSMKSKDAKIYRYFESLYEKYNENWTELQNILTMVDDSIPEILLNMSDQIFRDFQIFMGQIFQSHENKLKSIFIKYGMKCKSLDINDDRLKYFEPFLRYIFKTDQSTLKEILSKYSVKVVEELLYENLEVYRKR